MNERIIRIFGELVDELEKLPRGEMITLGPTWGKHFVVMHYDDFMEKYVRQVKNKCDGNHAMPVCTDPECWQK